MVDDEGTAGPPGLGIRVVDLGRIISGPLCTQLLADMGADVIKVERPGLGDEARSYHRGEVDGIDVSPLFASLNTGKRSIAVDLGTADGIEIVYQMVDAADVFVHNFRPGVVERLGLDDATLTARNPRLVYCSISGFGDAGPLRTKGGNDIAAQAYSGLMSIMGEADRHPIRSPVQVADFSSGYNAAVAVLGALVRRGTTGPGAVVTTSLLESMVSLMGQYLTDFLLSGVPLEPLGSGNRLGQPNQAFRTADGYVVISSVSEVMWARCATALGHPEWTTDPRFLTVGDRVAHQEELVVAIEAVTTARTTAELTELLDAAGVACSPINRVDEVVGDPQVASLSMLETVDYLGVPVTISASPVQVDGARPPRTSVPRLGQHTDEVLRELGYDDDRRHRLRADGVVG